MSEVIANGTGTSTAVEQRLLDKVRSLPPAALEELEVFVDLLISRSETGFYAEGEPPPPKVDLSADQGFLKLLRLLPPGEAQLLDQYALILAGRALKWSYDDAESLKVAAELMGRDPFLRREVEAINKEFACTDMDGLKDY
ncbi:MAG TPA: hypothetical protein VKA46_40150 [Gemmataceae bacterium]|nr:hypothetical protein [Gemmataceae bacterium]